MEILDDKIQELIALGASYAVNCKPCMEYHRKKAEKEKEKEAAPNAAARAAYIKMMESKKRGKK